MEDCACERAEELPNKLLVVLLSVNALMFFAEIGVGIIAGSTALMADSLDMFADASVFALALYAAGRAEGFKSLVAFFSGIFQAFLGLSVAVNVVYRFLFGSEPESGFMIGVGLLALAANVSCLVLLQRYRHGEVHIRSSWIFLENDALANLGTVISGILVALLHSNLPDLMMGALITIVVIRGAINILTDAYRSFQTKKGNRAS